MARNEPQINLRVPQGLKDQLAQAANKAKRTLTAEMVARLQDSFSGTPTLPAAVQQTVDDLVRTKGCTPTEALVDLVLAGQAQGGTVLNIRIAPGMTLKEVRDAISAMADVLPNATNIVIERE